MNNEVSRDHRVDEDRLEGLSKVAAKSPVIEEESAISQRFTCDIESNPFEPGTHMSVSLSARICGQQWRLEIKNLTKNAFQIRFSPVQGVVGRYVTNARVFMSIARIGDEQTETYVKSLLCSAGTMPWQSDSPLTLDVSDRDLEIYGMYHEGPIDSRDYPKHYRVVIEFKGIVSEASMPSAPEAAVARRMPSSITPGSKDICLSFSRDIKIWVDSKQLSTLSPFFTDCLSAGFKEGEVQVGVRNLDETNGEDGPLPKKRKTAEDFEDSDDESDQTLKKNGKLSKSGPPTYSFRTIPISQAAFVTYQATLVWQQTGFIRFAPLSSSFLSMTSKDPVSPQVVRKQQQNEISRIAESEPSLPYPVSPKSIYRLAHFLSIPELKDLALLGISQRLTPQGAIDEFLSQEASCYPEIRKVVFDYFVKHSQSIVESPGYKNMMKSIETGNTRYALLLPSVFEALSSSLPAKPEDFTSVEAKYPNIGRYARDRTNGELFP